MTRHDEQLKSENLDDIVFTFLDVMPFAFREAASNETNTIKFWVSAILLFVFSAIFVNVILYVPNISYVLGGYGVPDCPCFTPFFDGPVSVDGYFNFKSSLYNKEILSILAQIQAAIIGIWYALIFLGYSIQISNKAGSPEQIKRHLSSKSFKFVFSIFIISLTIDVVMLKYAYFEINLFWILSLSVYAMLLLPLYIYNILVTLSNSVIREEVLNKNARHNLKGSNLSLMDLSNFDLNNRDLTKCDLRFSNLNKTNFSLATFLRNDLRHANLNGANLSNAQLTRSNLESANFIGADLDMTRFGVDENLLKLSWGIFMLSITANNLLFRRIIYNPIINKFNLIDQENESDEDKVAKFLIEVISLIKSSRLHRLFLKLVYATFSLFGPKANRLNVTYDEITLKNLLNAKNLDKAEFYGPIKKDLIDRSSDMVNDPDIDLELKESLTKFLETTKVDDKPLSVVSN